MAAQATQNLANALVLLERYDEAEALYAEASDALDVGGLRADAAACRVNLAGLFALTDRLGQADALLRRAEVDLRTAGLPVQAALARRDRGDVLLRAGLVPEARHALGTARRAARRVSVFFPRALRCRGRRRRPMDLRRRHGPARRGRRHAGSRRDACGRLIVAR
jgi:tetratricopeptide (TPR) repeat protein